jgi:hypothetical protein
LPSLASFSGEEGQATKGKIVRLPGEALCNVGTLGGTGAGLRRYSLRYGSPRYSRKSYIYCSVTGGHMCGYCATSSSGCIGSFSA